VKRPFLATSKNGPTGRRLPAPCYPPGVPLPYAERTGQASGGWVANFRVWTIWGESPLSVEELRGQGVELFGRSEVLFSGLGHHPPHLLTKRS